MILEITRSQIIITSEKMLDLYNDVNIRNAIKTLRRHLVT